MATRNVGTLSGTIEFTDNYSKQMLSFSSSLGGLKQQALATATGFLGAQGLNKALSFTTRTISSGIKEFVALEKALAEVSTLVDTNIVDMELLSKGTDKLAKKYGMSEQGLSKALYQAISASVDAEKSINFLDEAVKTAIAGVSDARTAVDGLTSALNAYGYDVDKVKDISDSFFVTIKRGKTTLSELAPVIGQVAPFANTAGLALDEMNIALATLTQSGLGTNEAATALRGFLRAIIRPSDEAIEAAKKIGIEFNVSAIRAKGFTNWLSELAEKTGGSEVALGKLFPEIRGMNAALQLTTVMGIDTFNNGMDEMKNKAGASEIAFQKMEETTSMTWERMKEGWKSFWQDVGQGMIKFITSIHRASEATKEHRLALHGELDMLIKENRTYEESIELRDRLTKAINLLQNTDASRHKVTDKFLSMRINKLERLFDENEKYIDSIKKETEASDENNEQKDEAFQKRLEQWKRRSKMMEKLFSDIRKEQKEEDLKSKRIRSSAEEQIEILEALHNVRVRQHQSKIEMMEEEKEKGFKTIAELAKYDKNISMERRSLIDIEYTHAANMLSKLVEKKKKEAGDDKKRIEEIKNWYIAKSTEIKNDWKERVSKELNIQAKAQIEIDKRAWSRFSEEIHNNYARWKDDLKSGSSAAWSGLISDSNDAINAVSDLFGGLPEHAAGALSNLTNGIVSAISGNPIQAAVSGLKLIGNALFSTGKSAKEAAMQQRIAAEQAQKAAAAFLKSQGKLDFTQMSLKEIREDYKSLLGQRQKLIKETHGKYVSEDILKAVDTATSDEERFSILKGAGFKDMAIMREIIGKGLYVSSEARELAERGKKLSKGISTYSYAPDLSSAQSFSAIKAILDAQLQSGVITQERYNKLLSLKAEKHKEELTPMEYQQYTNPYNITASFSEGGIVTRPTKALIGEEPEAILPLTKLDRMESILDKLGMDIGSNKFNIAVSVTGDTDNAQKIGDVVGDRLITHLRSKGI